VTALIRALREDADPVVRGEAAWSLGRLRSHLAAEPLLEALSDKDPTVSVNSSAAIGRLDLRPLGERIARGLGHLVPAARANSALALGRMRYRGARARLLRVATEDSTPLVRSAAVRATGKLGDPRARADLRWLLDREEDAAVSLVIEDELLGLAGRAPRRPPSAPREGWLDLRVERGDGKPLAYRGYVLRLPDGTYLAGCTDPDGNGVLEGSPPGVTELFLYQSTLAPRDGPEPGKARDARVSVAPGPPDGGR
jgi:hypothetical protein